MPFGNGKKCFRGSFKFSIVIIKKYHPSGNLKLKNEGILQGLMKKKKLPISLNLNTRNTLGHNGLSSIPAFFSNFKPKLSIEKSIS